MTLTSLAGCSGDDTDVGSHDGGQDATTSDASDSGKPALDSGADAPADASPEASDASADAPSDAATDADAPADAPADG